eukprot:scaffold574_cov246-Pinguiococcus_pyrenoidosus.AAC.7
MIHSGPARARQGAGDESGGHLAGLGAEEPGKDLQRPWHRGRRRAVPVPEVQVQEHVVLLETDPLRGRADDSLLQLRRLPPPMANQWVAPVPARAFPPRGGAPPNMD